MQPSHSPHLLRGLALGGGAGLGVLTWDAALVVLGVLGVFGSTSTTTGDRHLTAGQNQDLLLTQALQLSPPQGSALHFSQEPHFCFLVFFTASITGLEFSIAGSAAGLGASSAEAGLLTVPAAMLLTTILLVHRFLIQSFCIFWFS